MDIKRLRKRLSEILFPQGFTCDICGVETFGDNLCPDCKKTVAFNFGTTCPLCGRRTVRPELCLECKEKPPAFKRAVSAIVHQDGGVFLVKKFKSGGAYLKEFFADLLVRKLENFPKFDGIVFVPATKKSVRKRGYNQSLLLAESVGERLSVEVIKDAIEKVAETKEQKNLTRAERQSNLASCFKIKNKDAVKDKTLLLVDDVLTTGATAETLCSLLLKAGAKAVYLATVTCVENKIFKEQNASDIKSSQKRRKNRE